jgi:hypothetical protein
MGTSCVLGIGKAASAGQGSIIIPPGAKVNPKKMHKIFFVTPLCFGLQSDIIGEDEFTWGDVWSSSPLEGCA